LAAQFKAGKTTLVNNLVRSLADGPRWLGVAEVQPVTGTVTVLDFEMGATQLKRWHRDQQTAHTERVIVLPLKGQAATFDLLDPETRTRWAAWLRAASTEYLMVDCLRPVLDALGLDEHHDAGRFLVAFDALLAEAGIPDALIIHHMGHIGERARGDSRLRDWPDVEWRLVRQDDNPASPRFLTAYGRDVDVPETALTYDPTTRRLSVGLGGSRKDAKAAAALVDVLDVLSEAGVSQSGRAIKEALANSDHSRHTLDDALRFGTQTGQLSRKSGPKRAWLYSSVPVSRSVPPVSRDTERVQCTSVPPLYKGGTLGHSAPDTLFPASGVTPFDPARAFGPAAETPLSWPDFEVEK
jgi:hypothetical protein